jgi:hypothetical protein
MDEEATFEARAVLAPRRTRLTRVALVVPVVVLVAIVGAGVMGGRSHHLTAEISNRPVAMHPTQAVDEPVGEIPTQVLGLDVHRLDDVHPQELGRDDIVVLSGWYVATAITNCPPLPAIYRDGALPYLRGDADTLVFCERSGVLYASRPDVDPRLPTNNLNDDNRSNNGGLPSVAATLIVGIIVPQELELIRDVATEVVVIGRFVGFGGGCRVTTDSCDELLVDHVAWTPGA